MVIVFSQFLMTSSFRIHRRSSLQSQAFTVFCSQLFMSNEYLLPQYVVLLKQYRNYKPPVKSSKPICLISSLAALSTGSTWSCHMSKRIDRARAYIPSPKFSSLSSITRPVKQTERPCQNIMLNIKKTTSSLDGETNTVLQYVFATHVLEKKIPELSRHDWKRFGKSELLTVHKVWKKKEAVQETYTSWMWRWYKQSLGSLEVSRITSFTSKSTKRIKWKLFWTFNHTIVYKWVAQTCRICTYRVYENVLFRCSSGVV